MGRRTVTKEADNKRLPIAVTVRLPWDDRLRIELGDRSLASLLAAIAAETNIPPSQQDLRHAGEPLETIPEHDSLEIDLVIRVGAFAIASAALGPQPGIETFHPAISILRQRDFEAFRRSSRRIRFSDNRPLEKTMDLDRATDRAQARLAPYDRRAAQRRAALKAVAADCGAGPLVAMTFNAPYAQLFENWHLSCSHQGIDVRRETIVFPMDPQADAVARGLGYKTLFDPGSYGEFEQRDDVKFGDRQWIDCLFMKNAVMGDMLSLGNDVLFQDSDVVWRQNPLPYLRAKAATEGWDFLFQKAGINHIFQPLYYNSGFVYARSNDFSRNAWQRVLENQRYSYAYRSQQVPLNVVMNTLRERGLRTSGLAPELFVNGHLIPATPRPVDGPLHPDAMIIHFNWTDGLATKLERLRSFGLWYRDNVPAQAAAPTPPTRQTSHGEHASCMICHQLRCIFVAIPKNGSSTIKAELRRLDPTTEQVRCTEAAEQWPHYFTFAFLRDPVSRVLSAYQEISMRLEEQPVDNLPFSTMKPGLTRFETFLSCIEERAWDPHITPQTDLVGDHRIDVWGRVESLAADFAKIAERLGTTSEPQLPQRRSRIGRAKDYGYAAHLLWEKDLPAATIERIRAIYATDIALLASLGRAADAPPAPPESGWTAPAVRRLGR